MPGPSLFDASMQHIRDLSPPFVGGENWTERRKEICDLEESEELCAHPFMSEDLVKGNPITVKDWELL